MPPCPRRPATSYRPSTTSPVFHSLGPPAGGAASTTVGTGAPGGGGAASGRVGTGAPGGSTEGAATVGAGPTAAGAGRDGSATVRAGAVAWTRKLRPHCEQRTGLPTMRAGAFPALWQLGQVLRRVAASAIRAP